MQDSLEVCGGAFTYRDAAFCQYFLNFLLFWYVWVYSSQPITACRCEVRTRSVVTRFSTDKHQPTNPAWCAINFGYLRQYLGGQLWSTDDSVTTSYWLPHSPDCNINTACAILHNICKVQHNTSSINQCHWMREGTFKGIPGSDSVKFDKSLGRLVTYSEVSWNVGSCQNTSGCREKDGKDWEEGFPSEVRTHVLPHDRTWQENTNMTAEKSCSTNNASISSEGCEMVLMFILP